MSPRVRQCFVLIVALLVSWQCSRSSSSTPPPTPPGTNSALKSAIAPRSAPFVDQGERGRHAWQEAQRFYKQNGYQLAWSDGTHPRAVLDGLVTAVRAADQDGLEPGDYPVDELDASRRGALDADKAVTLDLRATYTYLRYATDLKSMTAGQGSFTMEFKAYEAVPPNIQLTITEKWAKARAGIEEE